MEGNDRPIKFNPTGKYNLDFIDWDNEYENIGNFDSDEDKHLPLEESNYYFLINHKNIKENAQFLA